MKLRNMNVASRVDDLADDLRDIQYDVESLEDENEELNNKIEELENKETNLKSETVYDEIKNSFILEISKMYSLEELEKIFGKKQGYPLTKIK